MSLIATRRSNDNRWLVNTLVVALPVVVVGNVAIMASRGVQVAEHAATSYAEGQVRVLAWNTLGNSPGANLIAEFALEHRVDVLALAVVSSVGERRVLLPRDAREASC